MRRRPHRAVLTNRFHNLSLLQAELRLSRAVSAATGAPTTAELISASQATAATVTPLMMNLLVQSTLLGQDGESERLATLGKRWWAKPPLSRIPFVPFSSRAMPFASASMPAAAGDQGSKALEERAEATVADTKSAAILPPAEISAATSLLVRELCYRSIPRRILHGFIDTAMRSRSGTPATPPPLIARSPSAALTDAQLLATVLDSEAAKSRRHAPLFTAVKSEPELTRALAAAFYTYHDRLDARRRRSGAAFRLFCLFITGNIIDFVFSNI